MKKAKYYLALLAVVAVLTAGIGQAMAYFTTYTDARGGFSVWLGDDTKIEENDEIYNWDKILTITNEDGEPVFVRAKVFYAPYGEPDGLQITVEGVEPEEGSTEEKPGIWLTEKELNGELHEKTEFGEDIIENSTCYYYYTEPLVKGESAKKLKVHIGNIPTEVVEGDTFSVIVVYESVPAFYDEDGNAYAKWDSELKTEEWVYEEVEQEGGGEQ